MANSKRRATYALYIGTYALVAAIFLKLLYRHVISSFFEQDLLWCIPTIVQSISGLTGCKLAKFLLDPGPLWYGLPSLKIYMVSILSLFGPVPKYFIFTSIGFHFASSMLVLLLSRKMGLSLRASLAASMIYLTLFIQFGSYIWPMATQHLLVVFFTLLVLNLYFRTEYLIEKKKPRALSYIATLIANLAASLCRTSIMILPVTILTHILISSKAGGRSKAEKYFYWIPLFAAYLLYPLISVTYVGDVRMNIYLANANHNIMYGLFLVTGMAALVLFGIYLRRSHINRAPKTLKYVTAACVITAVYIFFCIKDVKNILLPFNFLVPFMSMTMSFLNPLQNVFMNDSARPYYFMYSQSGPFAFALTAFLLFIFFRNTASSNKRLYALIPWYCMVFFYVNLREPVTSRYFVYFAPVFCIVFASAALYVIEFIFDKIRLKRALGGGVIMFLFFVICVSNILAVDLTILRDRLSNNFYIYDYIRTAGLIREDILRAEPERKVGTDKLCISGVPEAYQKSWDISPMDPARHDNFKFVMSSTFNDKSMAGIRVNTKCEKGDTCYTVDGSRILGSDGGDIDDFNRLYEEACRYLGRRDYGQAYNLFCKAAAKRPFLINYILPGLDIKDLKWIMNEPDLRRWVGRICDYYKVEYIDDQRINLLAEAIDGEVKEYIRCLFAASYLAHRENKIEESRQLFSQIKFLESDYGRLYAIVAGIPALGSGTSALSFLNDSCATVLHREVQYRNAYEFERFLFKLISGINLTKR